MSTDTNKNYHPLLPKLGSKNQVGNFNGYGVWDQRESSELDKLSDSLKIERVATQINSIPDMWARPLLFEMAFYDSEHLLHKRTVAEWRGLLALLAFKEVRGFNVSVVEALPKTKTKDSDGNTVEIIPKDEKGNEVWPPFLSTLAKMAPNANTLAPSTLWLDTQTGFFPFIILFSDQPIGLLSPTTMVCTSTSCFNRLTGIRWSDGRFLKDPSGKVKEDENEKTNELNQKEQKKLACWLEELKGKISDLPNALEENSRPDRLIKSLKKYISDLGGTAGMQALTSTTGFGLTKGIFQFLDKPIKGDWDGLPDSHMRLLPSEGRTPAKTLFVVDKSIAQQWNMTETNIVVYRGATLADIPSSGFGRERKQIGGIRLQDNEELCLPDDIFTQKLYLIFQESALPGAMASPGSGSLSMQNQVVTPLLPLTEKILLHLDNDELQKNITFEQSSESIHVRLRLRLSGQDGSGKFVEFKREYGKDSQIISESVPVLEIWPNFVKDDWKLYFTYFYKGSGKSTFYGKPFVLQGNTVPKQIKGDGKETETVIVQTDYFPTAILCYALTPNVHVNRMDEQYAGLILLRIPERITSKKDVWKIGVDFGTTSTSVFTAVANNQGEPLVFRKELIVRVTAASDTERAKLYDEFIPGVSEKIPFLSFYQEFRDRNPGQPIDLISDGHIFFLDKSKGPSKIPENVSTNLKWSDDELDRDRATAFLEQISFHAMAEAASKGASQFSVRYSYPTSFSQIASSGLPQKWQQIVTRAIKMTGLHLANDPHKMSESHASAIYFADELKAHTKYGTICIDIGGGTSDVAIWQEDELRYQVSLRLAGREIFLNTLIFKPEFLEGFGTNVTVLRSLQNKSIEFYAQADAIINREGERWFYLLPNKLEQPDTKKLVQIIAIGLSGLFYYIGLIMRYLGEKGKYKPEIPGFYVGGNGCNLFHWISAGKYSNDSPINGLLKDVFLQASGLEVAPSQTMKIILSPSPKCEAARGLVGEKVLNVAFEATDDPTVLSGETILVDRKKQDHNTLVTSSLFKRSLEPLARLEQIESFIEIFNRYASKKSSGVQSIDYSAVSEELRKRLGGKLKDLSKKKTEEISVEPIFILALKTLLEISAEEWKHIKKS